MSSYSFSDDAIQDLDEICEYIARNNPSAASKLFDRIRERCKVVAGFPNMGKNYSKLSPGLQIAFFCLFAKDDFLLVVVCLRFAAMLATKYFYSSN